MSLIPGWAILQIKHAQIKISSKSESKSESQTAAEAEAEAARETRPSCCSSCLPLIYLFIYYFIWLIAASSSLPPLSSSPAPTHACRLKLNSCIMNKFIVVGFRVSIYLVATLRGLCSHKLGPRTPVPATQQPSNPTANPIPSCDPSLDCLWL